MSTIRCHGCHRDFAATQYFMAHIKANMSCAFTLLTRRKRNPDGTSRPVNGRVRKEWRGDSEAFVENLDTILEEEQQRMAALDLDVPGDDVFEFNEDDADSPACKRVRLELLEDRLSTTTSLFYPRKVIR